MICEYCLQITVLKKEEEANFKVGNRRTYRNSEGNLIFFKRVKATEYDNFVNEIRQKGQVKIS